MLKSIEAIITSASVSTDTIKKIDIPNSNIEVSCNRISIGGISKQYQNLILFAPSLVKGDKLITQTLAFSVPYRAVNLLYMTSSKVRYIIIANSNNNLAKTINKSLPSDLKKEFYEPPIPPIRNENNYKVRFIVFDDTQLSRIDVTNLQKMPDSDVTALKVIPDNGDAEKGTVEFYRKSESYSPSAPKEKKKYLKKSSLIGAIYSDTKEAYECNMNNVFSRLKLVTEIYKGKITRLRNSAASRCTYGNADSLLTQISQSSSNFNENSINQIAPASDSLVGINSNAKINSCPLIY
ncbi:hypothetical protein HYW99_01280 [Candidatus Woesearchaeota archaeon]|nr:hypothetical protein [Candidatus Woesearchaeota archaeon]